VGPNAGQDPAAITVCSARKLIAKLGGA
jgi:hypothetical protein